DIKMPSGIANTAHQKNAWAIRHQLMKTFPRRSYSVHSLPNAWITPTGLGSEKCSLLQYVRAIQIRTTMLQLMSANTHRMRGETSFRMVNKSLIVAYLLVKARTKNRWLKALQ